MNKKICPNCGGNGFRVFRWEAESFTEQCKACSSNGEVDGEKFLPQTYTEPHGTESYYNGPLLDPELFKNLRIITD
tara:strand:- start:268 stop:495 length:228 start_codon:yes stop_codon:yes gene_type:complete